MSQGVRAAGRSGGVWVAALAAAGAVGGCDTFLRNTEMEVGRDTKHEFVIETIVGATPPPDPGTAQEPDKAPPMSLPTLDRSGWPVAACVVPNTQPAHGAIYANEIPLNTSRPRDRGVYPTAMSAIDLTSLQGNQDQALEAGLVPIAAAGDILLMIPRMFVTPPWATTRTALAPYQRGPRVGVAPGAGVKPVEVR